MARFVAGFLTASALWGGAAGLYFTGVLEPAWPQSPQQAASADAGADAEAARRGDDDGRRRARRGARRRRARQGERVPRGTATTGDDLEGGARTLNMGGGGGEEQLSNAQIERAFDGAFGRIRRCLILAAGNEPVRGKITFGLRIESSGKVSRVNLTGPARVTTGEAGRCLRKEARGIGFPSFDGPAMVAHYPITLE